MILARAYVHTLTKVNQCPHIKIDLSLLPRAKIPQATILYNESKHNILAAKDKIGMTTLMWPKAHNMV